jgi:putative heme degradation protein
VSESLPLRALLAADSAEVLARLPRLSSVMLTTRHGGATHERIGPVGSVVHEGAHTICRGACHDARIERGAIASVVVDRSGRMRDMVLPRLDFRDAGGQILFSIIGMAGLDPFDAGIGDLPLGDELTVNPRDVPERGEVAEDDAGIGPFATAAASGGAVTIEMARPGLVQTWHGTIETVKPAMGFINVMRPDFHLHLKAGAIARWRKDVAAGETILIAEGAAGETIGLSVRADTRVLASFAA